MSRTTEVFCQAWQHHQANDFLRAEQLYLQILQEEPNHADALCFLGGVYHSQGKLAQAERNLRRALELVADYPTAQNLLGTVLAQQGRLDEALVPFEDLIARHPENAEGHNNLSSVLVSLGRHDEAIAHCRKALALMPDFAGAHNSLGNALRQVGKLDEAAVHFGLALRLQPNMAEAYLNLGLLCDNQMRLDEAERHYRLALRLWPSNKLRLVLASLLPLVYQSMADMAERRRRLVHSIQQLRQENVIVDLAKEEPVLDVPTLFRLPYHGLNDRDVQRDFASLFRPIPTPVALPRPDMAQWPRKIRIGFLSRFFKNHTIGRLMQGLIANLSRKDFDVTVLSVGKHEDEVGQFIERHADHFVTLPFNPAAALNLVAKEQLDVLFYTDIGMEQVSYVLAHSRLAPVQCTTWGHPDTTGIPNMDYFIASEALEGDGAEAHYTEKLFRPKTVPIYYYRPRPPSPLKDRSQFGYTAEDHLYGCLQSLFKFHPEFDDILNGILRGDPRGKLLLLEGPNPVGVKPLRQRFMINMPDVVDRIHFLPPLQLPDYINLMAVADVLLDPLHFGGGNTSYEGLAVGCPIVTLPSEFLRGRITFALYKQMQFLDCVVQSPQEYINLALRLGRDADYREVMRQKILAANNVLYENSDGIRELEQFFKQAVQAASLARPTSC